MNKFINFSLIFPANDQSPCSRKECVCVWEGGGGPHLGNMQISVEAETKNQWEAIRQSAEHTSAQSAHVIDNQNVVSSLSFHPPFFPSGHRSANLTPML